ncbi:MAG TPA: hypothetical protein VHE99_03295 [Gammaproteobacteria bacterium]|nr:hypothetical protein [Gammaproteobacteria bacterium]
MSQIKQPKKNLGLDQGEKKNTRWDWFGKPKIPQTIGADQHGEEVKIKSLWLEKPQPLTKTIELMVSEDTPGRLSSRLNQFRGLPTDNPLFSAKIALMVLASLLDSKNIKNESHAVKKISILMEEIIHKGTWGEIEQLKEFLQNYGSASKDHSKPLVSALKDSSSPLLKLDDYFFSWRKQKELQTTAGLDDYKQKNPQYKMGWWFKISQLLSHILLALDTENPKKNQALLELAETLGMLQVKVVSSKDFKKISAYDSKYLNIHANSMNDDEDEVPPLPKISSAAFPQYLTGLREACSNLITRQHQDLTAEELEKIRLLPTVLIKLIQDYIKFEKDGVKDTDLEALAVIEPRRFF